MVSPGRFGSAYRLIGLAFLVSLPVSVDGAGFQVAATGVRIIVVGTEAEAVALRSRIEAGESFDRLAREHSIDATRSSGGYLGDVVVGDLRAEFGEALTGLEPGQVSPLVRIGSQYFLLGFLSVEEQAWVDETATGFRALDQGDAEEATRAFSAGLAAAENFPTSDYRRVESLSNLANLHHSQQDYALSQPLFRSLLTALEEGPSEPGSVQVLDVLNRLAEAYWSQGDFTNAEPLYTRVLAFLEESYGVEDSRLVSPLANVWVVRQALGDYPGAEAAARRALAILELSLSPDDPALARVLNNLASLLEAQERYVEAEAVVRRAWAILEPALGPDHAEVSQTVETLASLLEAQGAYDESQTLYRRLLRTYWPMPPDRPELDTVRVLDDFVSVLRLAPFADDRFARALAAFEAGVMATVPGERLLLVLSNLLHGRELKAEAEKLLIAAAGRYPSSRRVRGALATLYLDTNRIADGLGELERGSLIEPVPGADLALDRIERSDLYRRIGDLQMNLAQLEKARSAYTAAIDLDPGNFSAHLGLGIQYLRNSRIDEALVAYGRASELDPEHVEPHLRFAQAYLNSGRFEESLDAASKALGLDPGSPSARFYRMRALVLLGRVEESQAESDVLRQVEADGQAREERMGEAEAILESAASSLAEGSYLDSVRLYQQAIDAAPDALDAYYLVLGTVQSELGQHREAVDTFLRMVERGLDDFVVHESLAREYDLLGDTPASLRHQTVYLRKMGDALRESVN